MRAHGGLVIADEVQVGYGRLGAAFWGSELHGVVPDIITVAKAAGNAYPLGAVLTRDARSSTRSRARVRSSPPPAAPRRAPSRAPRSSTSSTPRTCNGERPRSAP
ncbi:MAG: aminotransferase class III-fold pyridoxal phosphate-dependent enzyme [Microbacterium sp.]